MPFEVTIIQCNIVGYFLHVLCELPCTLEVRCFDAAARWCYSGVVEVTPVDHNRKHVMPESVVIELLHNVIIADGVLEC